MLAIPRILYRWIMRKCPDVAIENKLDMRAGRGGSYGLQDPIYTASEYILKNDLIWVILMRLSLSDFRRSYSTKYIKI
jgi:hypothetical protein